MERSAGGGLEIHHSWRLRPWRRRNVRVCRVGAFAAPLDGAERLTRALRVALAGHKLLSRFRTKTRPHALPASALRSKTLTLSASAFRPETLARTTSAFRPESLTRT